MADAITRLETIREMLLCAQDLYSWCLDKSFRLMYSNCPSQQFFYDLFSVGFCRDAIEHHFTENRSPVVVNDSIGFAWAAVVASDETGITAYHLLGPIFTIEASEYYLRQHCQKMKLPASLVNELFNQLEYVTTIPLNTVSRYAVMLHYCITTQRIKPENVDYIVENVAADSEPHWHNSNWHGTWEAERALFDAIREGKPSTVAEMSSRFANGQVGLMCPGDPLRQAQVEHIIMAVLCTRAAILGGVSPEGGYNLGDYYIQRSEACTNVSDVVNCSNEMFEVILQRVQQCKKNSRYSAPVSACMEYIETHLDTKINLEQMAATIGYTCYYLSGKFTKETGTSISSYIKERKIEQAKRMLTSTQLTAADVSERLAFSSPSYFGSVFRQYTGMSPGEYQAKTEKI